MEKKFNCFASAAFGMEGLVSRELKSLGLSDVLASNAGVYFQADAAEICSTNLKMHFSDRIFIILASGKCITFDQLFNLVSTVKWTEYFEQNESIDVSCKCSRSRLMSPRDCQSITKKAIIENIRKNTGQKVFVESGPSLPVMVSVRNDHVMILLNTSGAALSRRGYRTWNGEAPLRETLAAALVALSPWKPGIPLHDPCCGTGTILIEAARFAGQIAPGLQRNFAMESMKCFHGVDFESIKKDLSSQIHTENIQKISGSDIDPDALELAARHIRQSGLLQETIPLSRLPLQELSLSEPEGIFICNPPYGERLNDQNHSRMLYHDLFKLKNRHPGWKFCAITSDPAFERYFGKRADKKHRLYNGRLECVYYIYY